MKGNKLKRCKYCDNEFKPTNNRQKFCDITCKRKYHYRRKNPLRRAICPICQKRFTKEHNNQRTCSSECSKDLNRINKKEYMSDYLRQYKFKDEFKKGKDYLGSKGTSSRFGAIKDNEGSVDFEAEAKATLKEKWNLGLMNCFSNVLN